MVVQEDANGITADALMVKTNVKLVIRLSLETIGRTIAVHQIKCFPSSQAFNK